MSDELDEYQMTAAEAAAFRGPRNRAKIPARLLPPKLTLAQQGLTTQDFRDAIASEGPLAGQWGDKPHRLVYDLCSELERIQRKFDLVKERQCRIVGLRQAYESAQFEFMSASCDVVASGTWCNAWNSENGRDPNVKNPYLNQHRCEQERKALAKQNLETIKKLYDAAVDDMMRPLEEP